MPGLVICVFSFSENSNHLFCHDVLETHLSRYIFQPLILMSRFYCRGNLSVADACARLKRKEQSKNARYFKIFDEIHMAKVKIFY